MGIEDVVQTVAIDRGATGTSTDNRQASVDVKVAGSTAVLASADDGEREGTGRQTNHAAATKCVRFHDRRPQGADAAARFDPYPVAVLNPLFLGELRVYLDARLGILIDQRTDAARLRAGQVLADDAARRQDDRKLVVGVLGRRGVGRDDEARLAVGK